jgi:hypothetical protein
MTTNQMLVIATMALLALGAWAAPLEQVVPEGSLVQTQSPGVLPEFELKRGSLCNNGMKCTYDAEANIEGGTSQPGTAIFKLDRALHNIRYSIDVTPQTDLADNSRTWQVQGMRLFTADPFEREKNVHTDKTAEFKNCAALVVQSKQTGTVIKLVKNAAVCSEEYSSLLLSSVDTMISVKGTKANANKFSHRENVGEDQRKVDYLVQDLGNGETRLNGKVHHRFFNDDPTSRPDYDSVDHLHTALSKGHVTELTTHIQGESLLQHTSVSKIRYGPPESSYQGDKPDSAIHVKFSLTKIKEEPAAVNNMALTASQFVQQAKSNSFHITKGPHLFHAGKKEKPNPFATMNPTQQVATFNALVQRIPEMASLNAARMEAEKLMKFPAAQQIFHSHLKRGTDFPMATSAALMGAMQAAKHLPSSMLLDIIEDPSIDYTPRDQALFLFAKTDCDTDRVNINAMKRLQKMVMQEKRPELGIHTTALHVLHGMVADTIKCSNGAAQQDMMQFVLPTEQALQNSLQVKDWNNVNMFLVALGNSRLERHTSLLQQVVQHPSLPEVVFGVARRQLAKLHGESAKQLLISLPSPEAVKQRTAPTTLFPAAAADPSQVTWKWEKKFPNDGDKTKGEPDPRFQAIPALDIDLSKTKGASLKLSFSVKLWAPEYTYEAVGVIVEVGVQTGDSPPKPTVTITILKKEIFTTKKDEASNAKPAKQKEITIGSQKIGRCQTDVSKLNGLKYEKKYEQTFFEVGKITFSAGPVPMEVQFSIKGEIGFQAASGAIGGGVSTKLCEKQFQSGHPKSCSKTTHCGAGKNTATDGGMIFFEPYAKVSADGSAGVTAVIVSAGVGLNIDIVKLKFPMSLELGPGGNKDAECSSMFLEISAASGRAYVYFEAWIIGRNEWDLFDWAGPAYNYPGGHDPELLLGHCSEGAGVPKLPPPEMPKTSDRDCQVAIFPGKNFGGDVNYRYYVQSSATETVKSGNIDSLMCVADTKTGKPTGKSKTKAACKEGFKALPKDVQNNVKSVKTFGNCERVELLDDDWGAKVGDSDNGMLWDVQGYSSLPNDLVNDVQAVMIKALPPHEGKPKPTTDWHKKCVMVAYANTNFIGWTLVLKSSSTSGEKLNYSPKIKSVELSPGCKQVKLWDDDSSWVDNLITKESVSSLDNDLVNDVKAFTLTAKHSEEVFLDDRVANLQAQAAEVEAQGLPEMKKDEQMSAADRQKVQDDISGCWCCWTRGVAGQYDTDVGADDQKCWRDPHAAHGRIKLEGDESKRKETIAKYAAEQKGEANKANCPAKSHIHVDHHCQDTTDIEKKKQDDAKAQKETVTSMCKNCGWDPKTKKQKSLCKTKCEATATNAIKSEGNGLGDQVCPAECKTSTTPTTHPKEEFVSEFLAKVNL